MEGKPEEEILSVIEDSDLYVSAKANKEDIKEDVGEDGLKSNIIKTPKKEKTCEDKDNKDKEIEVLPSKQISETMEDAISNKSKKTKNTKDKKD